MRPFLPLKAIGHNLCCFQGHRLSVLFLLGWWKSFPEGRDHLSQFKMLNLVYNSMLKFNPCFCLFSNLIIVRTPWLPPLAELSSWPMQTVDLVSLSLAECSNQCEDDRETSGEYLSITSCPFHQLGTIQVNLPELLCLQTDVTTEWVCHVPLHLHCRGLNEKHPP